MHFEFSTPSKIIFGSGSFNSIGEFARGFGNHVLIFHGGQELLLGRAFNLLHALGIKYSSQRIDTEPTIENIRDLVEVAKGFSADLILGIGGGSTLDSAKAISVLLNNPGDITDYLEVIGLNKPIPNSPLPLIAVPTTAGTGSEVTKNAVLGSLQHYVKVSLRSPYLLPRIALVDPELTLTLPPKITAFTGLDALTQLIEVYTCITPNPITDALSVEGIQRIAYSIRNAYTNGNDLQAREDMSLASLLSGIALANAKLGAVHGLAGPIGGELNAPHGAVCACLLPHVMEANLTALIARAPEHPSLDRYSRIANILTGIINAKPIEGIQWISDFCSFTEIPGLSAYGLAEENFTSIIDKSIKASSMKGNPIPLSEIELRNILYKSL